MNCLIVLRAYEGCLIQPIHTGNGDGGAAKFVWQANQKWARLYTRIHDSCKVDETRQSVLVMRQGPHLPYC
uniref:Uncharacterized protein n=1 Tax=Rhizophora mucronata TaxID=61149 RepID=A0A2P2R2B8_RHIMU